MFRYRSNRRAISKTFMSTVAALIVILGPVLPNMKLSALTGSDFNPGNIISGAVFTNSGSMNVNEVQNFLSSKVTCDLNGSTLRSYYYNPTTHEVNNGGTYITTSRAVYGQHYAEWYNAHPYSGYITNQSVGPYVCLPGYIENPTTGQTNLQNPTVTVPGGQSAAQIILNAAQANGINPQVLLVTLQKEQGLITDDWPWTNEYTEALGFNCPDTPNGAACSGYGGFYQQVNAAAAQYRNYLNNPNSFNYVVGNNTILYNVRTSCSLSSVVNIQNQATAALYDYTPYQPDSSVLAQTNPTGSSNGPGGAVAGDACGSYGNRNFWWYFNTWFGSTQTTIPYAWTFTSNANYSDAARTIPYSPTNTLSIAPGGTAYITLRARNNGNQAWNKSAVHLGTSGPQDRASVFSDTSWLNSARVAFQESTVAPGDNATFSFDLKAPTTPGSYRECFNLVAENITWLADQGLCYGIDVVSSQEPNDQNTQISSGETINTGSYLMSPSAHSVLSLQTDGNLVLYSDSSVQWYSHTNGTAADHLVMQTDGNLVLYTSAGAALWSSGTVGNAGAKAILQSDGNLVIYSSGGAPLWSTGTYHVPSYSNTVLHALRSGVLYPQQSLQMADRTHSLVMQRDGNLVLYSNGHPVWASYTQNNPGAFATMQADGNLVIYSKTSKPLWATYTNNNPGSTFVLQDDGNLVIYNSSVRPVWHSQTYGR